MKAHFENENIIQSNTDENVATQFIYYSSIWTLINMYL